MATQSSLDILEAGTSAVATFTQTQGGDTVYVQQSALVDATTGQPGTIVANGMQVVPTLGTPNASGVINNSSVAAGASATLSSTVKVTDGFTGSLQHAIFSSTQPMQWTIQTVNNSSTAANRVTFFTAANTTYDYRAVQWNELQSATATTTNVLFQVAVTNLSTDQNNPANVFAQFLWAEN